MVSMLVGGFELTIVYNKYERLRRADVLSRITADECFFYIR